MSEEPSHYHSKRKSFILGHNKVLFINNGTENLLEKKVQENLNQIKNYYKSLGLEFIYMPEVLKKVNLNEPNQKQYFLYLYPYLVNEAESLYKVLDDNPYALVQETLSLNSDELPCVYYNNQSNKLAFKVNSVDDILQISNELIRGSISDEVLYKRQRKGFVFDEPQSDYFEEQFSLVDDEVVKFISEIEDPDAIKFIINLLSEKLSKREKREKLSRLIIDEKYRIRLIDYGDIEIFLTPLQKTVYLFFLNHPEGIMFNSVYEYRDELLSIYLTITNRSDMDQLKASIDDLVDPLSNSLSEKCSKIRSVFLSLIHKSLARNYFIDGSRGEAKSIKLPRALIEIKSNVKLRSLY